MEEGDTSIVVIYIYCSFLSQKEEGVNSALASPSLVTRRDSSFGGRNNAEVAHYFHHARLLLFERGLNY